MGSRRARGIVAGRKAGAGTGPGGGAGPRRCDCGLRHRYRNTAARPASDGRRRIAVQQEFHDRPRIYGHDRQARALGGRIPDRRPDRGRGPCRVRPLPPLPGRHVYLVPELRFPLERTPCERLHDRWRLRRICGQQCQHDGPYPGRHAGRGSDADRHGRHRDVRARRHGRADRRRRRRRDGAGADRVDGGRGRQGARRRAGHSDRHARPPARNGPQARGGCGRQRAQRGCRRGCHAG